MRRRSMLTLMGMLMFAAYGLAQTTSQPTQEAIDECGTLVQGSGCVLFNGGGGKYVLSDYGRYGVGDAVRVVGTLDTNCTTICRDADGCIRGVSIYDPVQFPCGSDLPNFPGDIVTNVCTAASTALLTVSAVGLWLTRRGGRGRFGS